jgi:hypothetical protein
MKSVGLLGWIAVGGSLASVVVTFTVDSKWIRVGCGLFAAALMIGWSISLMHRSRAQSKV